MQWTPSYETVRAQNVTEKTTHYETLSSTSSPTGQSWLAMKLFPIKKLLYETRTRILLFSSFLLLLTAGLAIPIFRALLFANIDARVEEDLLEEREEFLEIYNDWEDIPNQTVENLEEFVRDHFQEIRLEDDNFQIVLIDGEVFRMEPSQMIEPLRPGAELFEEIMRISESTTQQYQTDSADIGSILYTVDPLLIEGEIRGKFITAHSSAGERAEALVGVYLLAWVMLFVLLISLLLSWIAAGRLMSPVSSLAKTARAISESDLTRRIPAPHSDGELAELTHTFNAMMDRIQGAFDSQRAFINDAGHELRTPITIIQGHLELLEDDPIARQTTMELVMDELDRMGRLVGDLLTLAKSERPNFLQLETIELKSFTEVLFAKATALTERNWQLVTEGHGQGQISGDRQKLTGALLNLLRNAMQHTTATDTIELGYRMQMGSAHTRQVQFWVRDNGGGIHPADTERIFERFARAGQHRAERTGLGLSIASAIVDAHQGKLEVVSEYGKGATFYIVLPALP